MKNKPYYSTCFILSAIACISSHAWAIPSTPIKTTQDIYPSYTSAQGILAARQIPMEALWLHTNATPIGGIIMPKSFDADSYWQFMAANNSNYINYRTTADDGTCTVPPDTHNDATIERAMQQKGLDIYDGAVWQIALAFAAKNNPGLYIQDIEKYKNFLLNGVEGGFQSYTAFKGYTYNGIAMPSAQNAYLLKFVSPSWALNHDFLNNCDMQWPEWGAVTGEEAWAVLIGPVQSIYLLNDGAHNPNWSSSSQAGDYIQLGKNALGAIKQMQAPTGGVYRNVTMPNQAQNFDVSLENNFSLYAGLSMFEQALKARKETNTIKLKSLAAKNTKADLMTVKKLQQIIQSDQEDIATVDIIKKGMIRFFAGQGGVTVFDNTGHYFYSAVNGTTPLTHDFAVDVQTWGATVIATSPDLLQAMTDAYGADVMYNMLEAAITKSGYYNSNHTLSGVGYTAQVPTDSFYELSGEWTLGAINAAIVLADHYKNDADKAATLISQAKNMLTGLTTEASSLQGSPTGSTSEISYLYANKRTFIPFGWYSNKVSSTASTGWSLLVNGCFNPLELGGGDYQAVCKQLTLGK